MNPGDLCKSCNQGKLRPFHLSATEAIVKCSNTECESYLDFLPHETIVTTGPASTPSSRGVSRCVSPDSPALSQYSSTDLEVASLNKSYLLAKISQEQGSCSSQVFAPSNFPSSFNVPKSALPSIAKSASDLTEAERCNIDLNTASQDDVDFFLDSLVGDIPSPKPSLPDSNLARGLPSDCSAFSQVPSVSKHCETFSSESIKRNDFVCFDQKDFKIKSNCVYDKLSELCKSSVTLSSCSSSSVHDSTMLDDNQFLSPAGSVVSEDSGYNDEIPTAVAVSGSGTRGGQADTKTTSSSILTSVAQLGQETVTVAVSQTTARAASRDSNLVHKHEQVPFSPAPESCSLWSSPANTPTQPHSTDLGSVLSSVDSSKSTDSTNPDNIPLPVALLVVQESFDESEHSSKLHRRPSCFQSSEEVVRNEEIDSRTILPYAQLSLTNFFNIFEQNLAKRPSAVLKTSCQEKTAPNLIGSNIIKFSTNLSDAEPSAEISEACSSNVSESGGELFTLSADHSSDSLRKAKVLRDGRGRPRKKVYRKRIHNNCDTVQNEKVNSSLCAMQQNVETNENVSISSSALQENVDATYDNVDDNLIAIGVDGNGDSIQMEVTSLLDASTNPLCVEPLMNRRISPVPSSVGAPEVKTKRKYAVKRKKAEEWSAPRKSARNLPNPVESSRDTSMGRSTHNTSSTECQAESSVMLPPSLAHVRPSLAALLPPLPHHGPKQRCDGNRSNKRLKPSQPFRHLASNVNADPWAFPVILLDQLNIEVVVRGRPRKSPAAFPIPKNDLPIESTNECVSSCNSRINGLVEGAIPRSINTSDVQNSAVTEKCVKMERCSIDGSFSETLHIKQCLVENQSELRCESAKNCDFDGSSGSVSVPSYTPSITMTVQHSSKSSSNDNSISNNPSLVRVSSRYPTSNSVGVVNHSPISGQPISGSKSAPLRGPLRQASAHQPVLAVAPLDRGVATLFKHASPPLTKEKVNASRHLSNGFVCDKADSHDHDTKGHLKFNEGNSYKDSQNSNLDLLQKLVDDQTQQSTLQSEQLQEPLHTHRQSINIYTSGKLDPGNSNFIEVGGSLTNYAMIKQEPGLSEPQPTVIQSFPSLQTIPVAGSSTQEQPIFNGTQDPQYVVVQGQVYQVVQQSVQNATSFIQASTAGIIDNSHCINKTLQDPQGSVLQVQSPLALNYPQQQYYIQQPLPHRQQMFPQQKHVAMHPPVRVGPTMLTSSPQPSAALQAIEQAGQPAVFCQAGPHSRPRATLSSVGPDTSASRASSLMTFVPETSVGQRSLPQFSSSSYRDETTNSPSEISTCRVLKTGAVSSDHQVSGDFSLNKARFLSNNLHMQSVRNCNVRYVMSPGDTSTELVSSRRTHNVLGSSCNVKPFSPSKLVNHEDPRLLLPSNSGERAVFCSQLPLSSHPPSPESSPSSPRNFPLLGTSPDNSPQAAAVVFDLPSSRMSHAHSTPNAFSSDDAFTNSVDNSMCVRLLDYSSSSLSTLQLVLSDDDLCGDKCPGCNDVCMKDLTRYESECDLLCTEKRSHNCQGHEQCRNDHASVILCEETPSTITQIPSSPLKMPVTNLQFPFNDKFVVSDHSYQTIQRGREETSLNSVGICTPSNGFTASGRSTTVPLASPLKSVFSDEGGAVLTQPCKTVDILNIPKVSAEVQSTLQPNSHLYQSDTANEDPFVLDSSVELIAVPLEGLRCAQCNTDCWNKHALEVTNAAHPTDTGELGGQCNFPEPVHNTETASCLSRLKKIKTSEEKISLQTSPLSEDCTYNFDYLTTHDPISTFSALAKSIGTPKYQGKKERLLRVYGHKKATIPRSTSQLSETNGEHCSETLIEGLCQSPFSRTREIKLKAYSSASVYLEDAETKTSSCKNNSIANEEAAYSNAIRCTIVNENEMGAGQLTRSYRENERSFQEEKSPSVSASIDPKVHSSISYTIGEQTDPLSNKRLKNSLKKQRKQLVPSKFSLLDSEPVNDTAYELKPLLDESVTQTRDCVAQNEVHDPLKKTFTAKLASFTENPFMNPDAHTTFTISNCEFSNSVKLPIEKPIFMSSKLSSSSSALRPSPQCLPTSVSLEQKSTAVNKSVFGATCDNPNLIISSVSGRRSPEITETRSSSELTQCPSIGKDCVHFSPTKKTAMKTSAWMSPHVLDDFNDYPTVHSRKFQETKDASKNVSFHMNKKLSSQFIATANSRVQSSLCSSVEVNNDGWPSLSRNESYSEYGCSSKERLVGKMASPNLSDIHDNSISLPVIAQGGEQSMNKSLSSFNSEFSLLEVNRGEQLDIISKKSNLDVSLEEPFVRQSNRLSDNTIEGQQLARVAYLTVAKHLKKVAVMNSEKINETGPVDQPLACQQNKNASTSSSGRLPSDPPVQLFKDTSNWWSSRQQAAMSDEASLASSLQKDCEPVSSEDEDAASVSSFGQLGRARSFTLVELPDDHHAYEELIANGYSVEKPELKLPEGVKVLVSMEKQKFCKLWPRSDKYKNSAHSTKSVRKKLKTEKGSTMKIEKTSVDCRKVAQEAVDNIVATRLPEDIPAMVIVSVKGKLFMYGND